MTIQLRSLFLSAALAAMILPAAAQDNGPTTPPTPDPPVQHEKNVEHRSRAQQDRIAQGIKSGELTPEEAARLEKNETKLADEAKAMKEANGGKLTADDRAKLERQQGKLGKQIYQQKHDAQTENPAPKGPGSTTPTSVGAQRQENQQGRIAQGVQSGQLTSGEAARLENQQAKLGEEVKDMKAANGGNLTAADKKTINRQQRRLSRNIARQKHDNQHR